MADERKVRWKRRFLWVFGGLLLATFFWFVALIFWPRPLPAFPPLPYPNGYDNLVSAGKRVQGQAPDLKTVDTETLRAFVDLNRPAIELARQGLSRESVVPIDYDRASLSNHLDDMGRVRNLCRLLDAAGVLAEREERLDDAAILGMDCIRLGAHIARGGLLLDSLLGVACERVGLQRLSALRDQLDSDTSRKVIDVLQQVDSHSEPIEVVIRRESAWGRATADWRMRIPMMLNSGVFQKLKQPAEDQARLAVLRTQTRLRLLMTHLAIRRYRLAHGKNPVTLGELISNALIAIPLDPLSGRPFIYELDPLVDDGYFLHGSVPDPTADAPNSKPTDSVTQRSGARDSSEPK
jgi:hypothetical protein